MRQPFLTIGIASYNYLQYIERAFEQIKKQTFKDIEILYCDDGSTDGSVEKIKEIINREKDITIRLIEGQHAGILSNRNRIIDNANGKYLMICDADDQMLDGCLDRLCSTAKNTGADCIIGGFCEVNDSGRVLKTHIPSETSSKWLYTWHHGQIYLVDIVRSNGIRFEDIPDDVFYLQKIHKCCRKVEFVQDCVYAWYRHGSSTSSNFIDNQEWHPANLWRKIAAFISDLRNEMTGTDADDLNYYLCKWYYFNITDLWKESPSVIKKYMCEMRSQMESVNPKYLKFGSICMMAKARDTKFAKGAVIGCMLFEKLHALYAVILIRKLQYRLRR